MTRDPDLDAAIDELRYTARRLRQLQKLAAQPEDAASYARLASIRAELSSLHDEFSARGDKLRMAPERGLAGRTLLLFVEAVDDHRDRFKRSPPYAQLLERIRNAATLTERLRFEAAAESRFAEHARKVATHNAAAAASAVTYMEASR